MGCAPPPSGCCCRTAGGAAGAAAAGIGRCGCGGDERPPGTPYRSRGMVRGGGGGAAGEPAVPGCCACDGAEAAPGAGGDAYRLFALAMAAALLASVLSPLLGEGLRGRGMISAHGRGRNGATSTAPTRSVWHSACQPHTPSFQHTPTVALLCNRRHVMQEKPGRQRAQILGALLCCPRACMLAHCPYPPCLRMP